MPLIEITLTDQIVAFILIGLALLIIFLITKITNAKRNGEKLLQDKATETDAKMEIQRLKYENEIGLFEKQKEKEVYERANQLAIRFETLTLENERLKISKALSEQFDIDIQTWQKAKEKEIREDAKKRVQSINFGQLTEHLLPFGDEFESRGFNPKDARFLGNPVDFILFDGMTEDRPEIKIYFVEIKTGKSAINPNQRKIKDALTIEPKNVEWVLIRNKIEPPNLPDSID